MEAKSTAFHREAHRRIAETFPHSRLPFYQSLRLPRAFAAFRKIELIVRDEERAWRLFLLALHLLYEARHDLPPFSAAERKALRRHARSLRDIALRLRRRRPRSGGGSEPAALEKMADRLERFTHPSVDGIYNLKTSRGGRFDPGEAISILELAHLFRKRLPGAALFPIIADFMNALPGRRSNRNVQTIKSTLARLEGTGFEPRVRFTYPSPGLVTVNFRSATAPGRVRVVR